MLLPKCVCRARDRDQHTIRQSNQVRDLRIRVPLQSRESSRDCHRRSGGLTLS